MEVEKGMTGELPLREMSVVECGQGVAAAFAAKLLALLGAEVIKVEPPQGDTVRRFGPFFNDAPDPENSGLFLYLNADKYGVMLDLSEPAGRAELDTLLTRAEVLIHNFPPAQRSQLGFDSENLCRAYPNLIVTGISPYGDWGPRAFYHAYEINVMHAGGAAATGPIASPYPDLPPLRIYGQQAEFQGGLFAAMGTLAAYFHRMRTGTGQAVEVSEQECIVSMLELGLVHYTFGNRQCSRFGHHQHGPWGFIKCADGTILFSSVDEAQWQRLLKLMGDPEWGREKIFEDRYARARNCDALSLLMEDWAANWKVLDLYRAAQDLRIPVAPLNNMERVYREPHLQARGFFRPLPMRDRAHPEITVPSVPFRSTAMDWRLSRPAPILGEHNRQFLGAEPQSNGSRQRPPSPIERRGSGPLAGVKILDFSWVWSGPFCTLQLAHLGAEIIRVESSARLCICRQGPPFADDKPGVNRCGSFNQWNLGKRSLRLNLERPEAIKIAKELVKHCDVVVENFAPGVIERMGLGYQTLCEYCPNLIMLSLSGYGQTGPYSRFVSYGPLAGAQAGLFSVSGYPNDEPRETGISYADPNVGVFGAYLLCAALADRSRHGRGQYIDLSMWEALEMLMPEALLEFAMNQREPARMGNRHPWMAPYNCYKSLGDAERWVTIAVGSESEWRALCLVIGRPSLAKDARFATRALRKRHEDELDNIINNWTSKRDQWEVTELLQAAGVAAFPTMINRDLARDAHLLKRGFLIEPDHPEIGRRMHAGVPWQMSATPCRVRGAAPLLGADTDDILRNLLGYSEEQLVQLRQSGVVE